MVLSSLASSQSPWLPSRPSPSVPSLLLRRPRPSLVQFTPPFSPPPSTPKKERRAPPPAPSHSYAARGQQVLGPVPPSFSSDSFSQDTFTFTERYPLSVMSISLLSSQGDFSSQRFGLKSQNF